MLHSILRVPPALPYLHPVTQGLPCSVVMLETTPPRAPLLLSQRMGVPVCREPCAPACSIPIVERTRGKGYMPARSKAQLRAMYAAAGGKSNLGIPKKVGKEFTSETTITKGLPERKGSGIGKRLLRGRKR